MVSKFVSLDLFDCDQPQLGVDVPVDLFRLERIFVELVALVDVFRQQGAHGRLVPRDTVHDS